jgi:hypothetical protein
MNYVENDASLTGWFLKDFRIHLGLIGPSKNGLKLLALPSTLPFTAFAILLQHYN